MEIAVRDAFIVGLGKAFGQLTGDANGIFDAQRTSCNGLSQRLTIIARHTNKEAPVRGFINIMDCANIGMIESGCSTGFTNEPLAGEIVFHGRRRKKLQRNRAVEVLILCTMGASSFRSRSCCEPRKKVMIFSSIMVSLYRPGD